MFLATDNAERTVLNEAAEIYNVVLFKGKLFWAKKYLTKEEANKFYQPQINPEVSFSMRQQRALIKIFLGILNWAKETLTKEEVNKLFLSTDNAGSTVIHVAAKSCNVDGFQGISNLAKKNLTKEVVNKLLLATNNAGRTVFHEATKTFNEKVFQGILN